MEQQIITTQPVLEAESQGFTPYTADQKRKYAVSNAVENAKLLSSFLGYEVNNRLPFVLLQAASDVIRSISDRTKLKTRICFRADHYANTMKVLAIAILHYDLASNLVGVRDQKTGKLERCENNLFAEKLDMPPRTVDNCVYTLKRSGLYLSFEQREEKETETGLGYRGVASIKRLNMVLFEMLGLGGFVSVQRAKAKQRQQLKRLQRTPAQDMLDDYRRADDKVRAKRNKQRADAKLKKQSLLAQAQSGNRTLDIIDALERGETLEQIKAAYNAPVDDIPY
ncbi:hypothetical protein A6E13_16360 [Aliivibrio fischeri]|uniref:hypothetical protein n=1 Tax=Aliivibrio fischeri TaxID=668 RepID=UPI00080DCC7C|nr:hypothetical protein [Aliivibrio fischeri]OCH31795.1 hypothetical protein A6E13_16360 [Aliivibrio fischeri]